MRNQSDITRLQSLEWQEIASMCHKLRVINKECQIVAKGLSEAQMERLRSINIDEIGGK